MGLVGEGVVPLLDPLLLELKPLLLDPNPLLLEPNPLLLDPLLLDPELPALLPWALLLTKVRDGHAACPIPSPTTPAMARLL